MTDIDKMDIFYYLEVLAYKIKKMNKNSDKNVLKGLPDDD